MFGRERGREKHQAKVSCMFMDDDRRLLAWQGVLGMI